MSGGLLFLLLLLLQLLLVLLQAVVVVVVATIGTATPIARILVLLTTSELFLIDIVL